MSLQKKYISSTIVSLIGKGFNMVSMLGILWVLNDLLGKEGFGLFMVAFSMMFTIAMTLASGFQSLLMYHVSRLHQKQDEQQIQRISGQIFWLTALLSGLAALIVYALSSPLEVLMNIPGLGQWIAPMALFIPAHACAIVLPSLPRARQNAEKTIIYQEIMLNGLRIAFLGAIWLFALPNDWVSPAYIASAAIPVILLFIQYPVLPSFKDNPLKGWDARYVFNIGLFQLLNQPFRGLDILLVGAFSSAGVAADYTMATRLVQLLWMPVHAASQLQVPRMGALLDAGNRKQLMLEFDTIRSITMALVLMGGAFLMFFGGFILDIFGDYQNALPVLFILMAATFVRTGAGNTGDFMTMTGNTIQCTIIAAITMSVTIIGCMIFVPSHGASGGALTMFVATLVSIGSYWGVLYFKEHFQTQPIRMLIFNMMIVLLPFMPVLFGVMPLWIGIALCGVTVIAALIDRSWILFFKSKGLTHS